MQLAPTYFAIFLLWRQVRMDESNIRASSLLSQPNLDGFPGELACPPPLCGEISTQLG